MAKEYGLPCPVAKTLDIIGDRWTLLIVRDLLTLGPRKYIELSQSLQGIAPNVLSDRLKQLVEATGTTVGLPDLRAGTKIRIRGLGARFSGRYFVTKTTHTLDASGYRTKFTARREAPLPEGTR